MAFVLLGHRFQTMDSKPFLSARKNSQSVSAATFTERSFSKSALEYVWVKEASSTEARVYAVGAIGVPLSLDSIPLKMHQIIYARRCVMVEAADEQLPTSFDVDYFGKEVEIPVSDPWKPSRCEIGKVFGHSTAHCQTKEKEKGLPKRKEKSENVVSGLKLVAPPAHLFLNPPKA